MKLAIGTLEKLSPGTSFKLFTLSHCHVVMCELKCVLYFSRFGILSGSINLSNKYHHPLSHKSFS